MPLPMKDQLPLYDSVSTLPNDGPLHVCFHLVQQQCQRRLTFQNVNNEIGCQVIQTANLAYGQER